MKNIHQMRLYLGLMIINLDNLHNKVNFKLENKLVTLPPKDPLCRILLSTEVK